MFYVVKFTKMMKSNDIWSILLERNVFRMVAGCKENGFQPVTVAVVNEVVKEEEFESFKSLKCTIFLVFLSFFTLIFE